MIINKLILKETGATEEAAMGGWKQVSGDMIWERHGVVLAKLDTPARQVELVRITPWIEHDSEAAVSHGLYLVDSTTVDFEDLGPENSDVVDAVSSVEMDAADYAALDPEHKAELLSYYRGYEDSRSVDELDEALPGPVDEIEFWGGKETKEKLAEYDHDLRRECLEANFKTRMTSGVMPSEDALTFALGDSEFSMELKGQDALAFNYATIVADVSGDTYSPAAFATTVQALANAPSPTDLESQSGQVGRILAEWEEHYGDPSDEDDGIANAAMNLASSMMENLGFDWAEHFANETGAQ